MRVLARTPGLAAFLPACFLVLFLVVPATALASEACEATLAVASVQRSISGAGPGLNGTQTVSLPDQLPVALRNERVHISYTLDVSACADEPASALWLFRVSAPYRVSANQQELVLLNSRALLQPDVIENALPLALDGVHNGRIPALFALPQGATSVTIELLTLPFLPSGIVRAQLGPTNLLLPVQAEAAELVVAYMEAAAAVLLVLSLMALLLWLARRSDRSLLWLAVACGFWSMRGLIYFGHKVYIHPLAYEQFNSLNVLLACGALAASIMHMLGSLGRRERLALQVGVTVCVSAFVMGLWAERGSSLVRMLCLLGSFAMVCWLLLDVWRSRATQTRWHSLILAGGLAGLIAVAVHDLMLLGGALAPHEPSYVFWGFVVMLTGFAAMSGHYVVLTLNRAERSNEDLELRVADKTLALQHSYERLRESEQDAVRAGERERLLRDMHDGLGAQLMTALRGVERGALAPHQVAQSLQDSLDELRLLMDSTDLSHYLPGALAAWRNRWDARLAAAGVTLVWRIDDSLDPLKLPSDVVLQIMRILQEAATNIVKHSQAQHMLLIARVEESPQKRALCISIVDDGVGPGPEVARPGARGLKNMHYRAGQIGAQLTVARRAPPDAGCQVELSLPLA